MSPQSSPAIQLPGEGVPIDRIRGIPEVNDARAVAKSLVARCLLLTPKTEMALILAGSETTQNELAAEGIGFAASRLTEEVGWISSLVSSISEENHLRF